MASFHSLSLLALLVVSPLVEAAVAATSSVVDTTCGTATATTTIREYVTITSTVTGVAPSVPLSDGGSFAEPPLAPSPSLLQ
ncbi:hypothetical protein PG990_007323 [Apiospora arundinis]